MVSTFSSGGGGGGGGGGRGRGGRGEEDVDGAEEGESDGKREYDHSFFW